MKPHRHDLYVLRGDTFEETFNRTRGRGVRLAQGLHRLVRCGPDPGRVRVGRLVADLSVTLGGDPGTIAVALSDEDSADVTPGEYNWDLKLVDPDGKTATYVTGKATVDPRVTVPG